MIRCHCVVAFVLLSLANGTPLRAHEVFRFIGTVTKWDPKTHSVDISSREEWKGQVANYPRHLVLRDECKVMREKKEVPRAELKPGAYVVVDAVGVDINDLEATEISLKSPPPPPREKK